jgi:hypothetical protein
MTFEENKSFKTTINRRFTSPLRTIYQEVSEKTLNIHKDDVWADTIDSTPATAVGAGVAESYVQQILTPDPVYSNNAFFFMVDSGAFVAGVDDYDTGIANNALRKDFISEKYGTSYKAILYDFNGNMIGETDPIDWFFDYVTGVLYVENPGTYTTPYKLTVYRYTGSFIGSGGSGSSKLNITDRNLTASLTTSDGDLACATAISETPEADSGVRVYINSVRVSCGNTVNDYCYFSADGGTTPRAFGSEQAGDLLYWNGSVAEYELETDDFITFDYIEA